MQLTNIREDNWNRLLVRVGKQRDKVAFEALFDHFAPLILGFCLDRTDTTEQQADELLQEVMLTVWQKAPSYQPQRLSASTWIFTVVRNSRIKLSKHEHLHERTDIPCTDDIWDDITQAQPYVFLQRSRKETGASQRLQNLPVEQFHVVRKIYSERRPHHEIADDLGLPIDAVSARLGLAIQKLQLGPGR